MVKELVLCIWLQGKTITVKLADTHKGKPVQTQIPAAIVPLALPLSAGYPQPGKPHGSHPRVSYSYPHTMASYPPASYQSPTALAPYPSQPPVSYPQVPLKKDPIGPTNPMGMGGYPYYMGKQ